MNRGALEPPQMAFLACGSLPDIHDCRYPSAYSMYKRTFTGPWPYQLCHVKIAATISGDSTGYLPADLSAGIY